MQINRATVQSTDIMYISLIIVSVLYVGIANSISCYNCVGTSNDTQAGQTSNCRYSDGNGGPTCTDGDFCLVTTLYYDESIAPPTTIVWRQCGNSASLPSGVNTGQCSENSAAFNQMLYLDRNLCCYRLEYNQIQHHSSATYCFCTSDNCNDLQYRTNFTFSGSTQVPGVSQTSIKPSNTATDFTISVLQLGIGLGASCGVVIFILLGVVISVCIENRSLRQYKRANQRQSPGQDKGHGQYVRQQQTIPAVTSAVADPSTFYERPLTPASYRQYASIDPYYHTSSARSRSETSNYYETPSS